jgi:hypothetical protein
VWLFPLLKQLKGPFFLDLFLLPIAAHSDLPKKSGITAHAVAILGFSPTQSTAKNFGL